MLGLARVGFVVFALFKRKKNTQNIGISGGFMV